METFFWEWFYFWLCLVVLSIALLITLACAFYIMLFFNSFLDQFAEFSRWWRNRNTIKKIDDRQTQKANTKI